jgi:predicted ATPase
MSANAPMNRFVVISGCSGGGKSTLPAELARRGHAVVVVLPKTSVTERTDFVLDTLAR